jgi:hypothetical protein
MARSVTPSLWPREHGAYAQLAVAVGCGLALAPSARSLAQGLATAALFLASEPLLVRLGRRNPAAAGAGRRLALLGALAVLGGGLAWAGVAPAQWLSLLPVALLGLGLFGLFLARRERTAGGEVLAAWTFAAASLPMAVLGGRPVAAATLALILAALFTLGTALVHGHLIALRRGGAGATRLAAFLFGALLWVSALGLVWAGRLSAPAALAPLPMTLAALVVWLRPPAPRRLKMVGWAAAGCALVGGALAVLGLPAA